MLNLNRIFMLTSLNLKQFEMKRIILLFNVFISLITYSFSQETYKIGKTEYYYNEYYLTTGKPLVKRSETNKSDFLKSIGYNDIPFGYQIDHIIPLSEGGTDDPSNMQLLTIEQHALKTANERNKRSNSTNNVYPEYKSNTTYNNYNYSAPKSNYSNSTPNYNTNPNSNNYSAPKTIRTGPRGGQYYINSNGNKTYIKK